jgi:hypothetical protein
MLHSRVLWKVHSKDHPVAVTYINNDTATDCSYTTLLDSTGASEVLTQPFTWSLSVVKLVHVMR